MTYLEKQIAEEFCKGSFSQKNIVLFHDNHESRLAACALINRGVTPKGIITLERKKRNKSVFGIPAYTVNEFFETFRRDAFVVIFEGDFFWWRGWFEGKGYSSGHKLLVTYREAPREKTTSNGLRKLFPQKTWQIVGKRWLGYQTWRRLQKKYGRQMPIYVYDYDGLGDAYVFGALLKAQYGDNVVVTVKKASLKKVLDMFEMRHVEVLREEESRALYTLMVMERKPPMLHPMTPVPQNIHTDILWCLYGVRINMLEQYKAYLGIPLDSTVPLNEPCPSPSKDIDTLFLENEIIDGHAVVLSPFSNSLVSFPYSFWQTLTDTLMRMGYQVIMNSVGDEYVLPGTITLEYPIKHAPYVVEKAGYFVGIRSGFCDLISNTKAFKIVVTPKMEKVNFNGHIFQAFSFHGMQLGKNIDEFEWEYGDYAELIRTICAKLGKRREK